MKRLIFCLAACAISCGCLAKADVSPEASATNAVVALPGDGLPHVIPEFKNMRDLGGWTGADGRKVKCGVLFRSPAVSKAVSKVENGVTNRVHVLKDDRIKPYCLDTLHIKTDLDLRFTKEVEGLNGSPLGPTVAWEHVPVLPYTVHARKPKDGSPFAYKKALDVVFDTSKQPVLIHCAIGADRTGCVCALALGILGVSEADIRRDYTTTPWLKNGSKKFEKFAETLRKQYPADSLTGSIEQYAKFLGYTDADIAAIRTAMLEAK